MVKRRTLIKALLTLTLFLCAIGTNAENQNGKSWETLIKAISAVESGNDVNAKNGQHVGILQISPCVVDDCNKICKEKRFKYSDRYSKEKSIEMFNIYQSKYNPKGELDKALRVWNGGPGYTIRGTNRYVKRVMKKYYELLN
jgi:hypothetical protein